jgi:hypothetical protein
MNHDDLEFKTLGSPDMTILRSVTVDNKRALGGLSGFLEDSEISGHVEPETKAILMKLQSSLKVQ